MVAVLSSENYNHHFPDEPEYLNKNPGGQMPALELDDGTILAETVVICDYLEELHPTPALIGTNAQERAEARMWNRRIEKKITENIYNGFRFGEGIDMFKNRMRCLPEAADGLKASAQDGLAWLDKQMEGKNSFAATVLQLLIWYSTAAQIFRQGWVKPLTPLSRTSTPGPSGSINGQVQKPACTRQRKQSA